MKSRKLVFKILSITAALAAPAFLAASAYALPLIYVANQADGTISIINSAEDKVLETVIDVGGNPQGIAASPDGSRIYVSTGTGSSVSIIDTGTNQILDDIDLGTTAYDVRVSPAGDKIYVAEPFAGKIAVIDTTDNSVSDIDIPNIYYLNFNSDGQAYASDFVQAKVVIIKADGTLGASIPVGMGPLNVAFTPDGTRAFVANKASNTVSIINASDGSFLQDVAVGTAPKGVAVSPNGAKVYVANQQSASITAINITDNTTKTINVGGEPISAAFSFDSKKAYVTNAADDTVSIIDVDTEVETSTLDVGNGPSSLVAVNVITCGDGTKEGSEQCDDGNTTNGDNCSSTCKLEANPLVCGNGIVEGDEECDDGNGFNNDECSNACTKVVPASGDGCSLSGVASSSAFSFLPLGLGLLAVAFRRFKKQA